MSFSSGVISTRIPQRRSRSPGGISHTCGSLNRRFIVGSYQQWCSREISQWRRFVYLSGTFQPWSVRGDLFILDFSLTARTFVHSASARNVRAKIGLRPEVSDLTLVKKVALFAHTGYGLLWGQRRPVVRHQSRFRIAVKIAVFLQVGNAHILMNSAVKPRKTPSSLISGSRYSPLTHVVFDRQVWILMGSTVRRRCSAGRTRYHKLECLNVSLPSLTIKVPFRVFIVARFMQNIPATLQLLPCVAGIR